MLGVRKTTQQTLTNAAVVGEPALALNTGRCRLTLLASFRALLTRRPAPWIKPALALGAGVCAAVACLAQGKHLLALWASDDKHQPLQMLSTSTCPSLHCTAVTHRPLSFWRPSRHTRHLPLWYSSRASSLSHVAHPSTSSQSACHPTRTQLVHTPSDGEKFASQREQM